MDQEQTDLRSYPKRYNSHGDINLSHDKSAAICRVMRIIWTLLLLFTMGASVMAEVRGFKVMAHDSTTGASIDLYRGSYALLIGVSDYQHWPDIQSIPGELERVEKILKAQGFSVEKHLNSSNRELKSQFENFIDEYGYDKDNRLLFFFAGHGHTLDKGRRGYLVPADAPDPNESEREFKRKSLPMTRILAWARESDAKHSLFLFDSCFSGTIFKTRALPEHPPTISTATSLPVRQFITAGSAGELVPAQSTFTPAFVDAIEYGKGDLNQDGYVSGTELGLYLQQEIPKHLDQVPQFGKIQDYDLSRGDFIFVLPGHRVAKESHETEHQPPAGSREIPAVTVDTQVLELEFWQSIKESNDPALYRLFQRQFPDGIFSSLARQKLSQIEAERVARLQQQDVQRQREETKRREQEQEQEQEQQLAAVKKQQQDDKDQVPDIIGLWIDKKDCHISIVKDSAGSLVGAAWGPYRGSMQIELKPLIENQRRFDWKGGRRTDSVDPSLIDPKRKGRFTINTYDRNKLHTTTNICSQSAGASVTTFKRALSQTSYRVKPPRWVVSK